MKLIKGPPAKYRLGQILVNPENWAGYQGLISMRLATVARKRGLLGVYIGYMEYGVYIGWWGKVEHYLRTEMLAD